MRNIINQIKQDITDVIKKNLNSLKEDVINDSPVLTGNFKSRWVSDIDYSNFQFRMANDTVYGLRLWRYHHSQKGWSPITGDSVVTKHKQELYNDIKELNRRVYRV